MGRLKIRISILLILVLALIQETTVFGADNSFIMSLDIGSKQNSMLVYIKDGQQYKSIIQNDKQKKVNLSYQEDTKPNVTINTEQIDINDIQEYNGGVNYLVVADIREIDTALKNELKKLIDKMTEKDKMCFRFKDIGQGEGFSNKEAANKLFSNVLNKENKDQAGNNDSSKMDRDLANIIDQELINQAGRNPVVIICLDKGGTKTPGITSISLKDNLKKTLDNNINMRVIQYTVNDDNKFSADTLLNSLKNIYLISFKQALVKENTQYTISLEYKALGVEKSTFMYQPVDNGFMAILKTYWLYLLVAVVILIVLVVLAVILLVPKFKKGSKKPVGKHRIADNTLKPEKKGLSFGNAQNIGKREDQQDAFGFSDITNNSIVDQKGAFAIVADGMGGLSNGRESSDLVVATLLNGFERIDPKESIPVQLKNMVYHANKNVYEAAMSNSQQRSGSTVVAALIKGSQLYWISVGDSRIYLFRNNRLYQMTKDHAYISNLEEDALKGSISLEQARNHPDRKALTSYLGSPSIIEIDQNLKPFYLYPGDRIALCSDGIFGSLTEEELSACLRLQAYEAAEEAINRILAKNYQGQDNMTIVIIGLD